MRDRNERNEGSVVLQTANSAAAVRVRDPDVAGYRVNGNALRPTAAMIIRVDQSAGRGKFVNPEAGVVGDPHIAWRVLRRSPRIASRQNVPGSWINQVQRCPSVPSQI